PLSGRRGTRLLDLDPDRAAHGGSGLGHPVHRSAGQYGADAAWPVLPPRRGIAEGSGLMDFLTLLQILDSAIRLGTPLLLACLAGLFSERAGVFDIGLEGKMLVSACFSAAIAYVSGDVWVGLAAGIFASRVLSMVHGVTSITFRGDQLISGVAINFLAAGLTVLVAQNWFRQGGRTPSLSGNARFNEIKLPFADQLSGVPI